MIMPSLSVPFQVLCLWTNIMKMFIWGERMIINWNSPPAGFPLQTLTFANDHDMKVVYYYSQVRKLPDVTLTVNTCLWHGYVKAHLFITNNISLSMKFFSLKTLQNLPHMMRLLSWPAYTWKFDFDIVFSKLKDLYYAEFERTLLNII